MRTREFYFGSNDGKTQLHAVEWRPETEPKAVLQIVHGMSEHIGRYADFARFMAEAGYLVVGDDHLGHGKSVPEDGRKGYFCEGDAAAILVRDEHKLHQVVYGEHPTLPYFILGHSMGSFIVRNYVTVCGREVQGAAIVGTGMQPKPLLMAARTLVRLVRCLRGDRYVSGFINRLAFGGYTKRIPDAATGAEWLTTDTALMKQYIEDPDCGFTFTVNGFAALFELIWRLYDAEKLAKIPKNLPMFFLSGADDPVGDYGRGVRAAVDSVVKAGVEDVTVKLYPGGRHEILNERNREEVYRDVLAFFEGILERGLFL